MALVTGPAKKFDHEVGQRSLHGTNRKGLSQGSCIPNINALSFILQKILARLKYNDRQTDEWVLMSFAFVKGGKQTTAHNVTAYLLEVNWERFHSPPLSWRYSYCSTCPQDTVDISQSYKGDNSYTYLIKVLRERFHCDPVLCGEITPTHTS